MKTILAFTQLAQSGKNKWWQYLATILTLLTAAILGRFLVTALVQQLIIPAFKSSFTGNQAVAKLYIQMMLTGCWFGILLLALFVSIKLFHKRSYRTLISNRNRFNWKQWFTGAAIWGGICLLSGIIYHNAGWQQFLNGFNAAHFIPLFLVALLFIGIQGFFEEVFFRGYLLQAFTLRSRSKWWPVIASSVLFTLLHPGYNLQALLFVMAFGIIASRIVIRQDGVEYMSGVHAINNLLLGIVFIEPAPTGFDMQINWIMLLTDAAAFALLWLISTKMLPRINTPRHFTGQLQQA